MRKRRGFASFPNQTIRADKRKRRCIALFPNQAIRADMRQRRSIASFPYQTIRADKRKRRSIASFPYQTIRAGKRKRRLFCCVLKSEPTCVSVGVLPSLLKRTNAFSTLDFGISRMALAR